MISKVISCNGFPANARLSIIRNLKAKYEINSNTDCNKHNTNKLYHLIIIFLMILNLKSSDKNTFFRQAGIIFG